MNIRFALSWCVICLFVAAIVPSAQAQGPPGGGFGGPPGGGFGGPPGGGFDPSSFLSRMDTNGNGVLEPDEMQGRARFFLERMAQSVPGMDLNRPIPLSRLSEAFARMRSEWSGGGGSGGTGRDSSGGPSSGGPSSGGPASSSASVEPLVPGFGIELALDPIPGFGSDADRFSVRIVDADNRDADQSLARNDTNKDGVLDKEEIGRGRWRDDPLVYDRNRDGKLSRTELAMRYAVRRVEREGGSSATTSGASSSSRTTSSRSSGSATSSRSGSSSTASSSADPRLEGLLRSVFERYDRNRNGEFERDEWSSFRTDPSDADKNRDGKISRSEISAWLQERYLGGGGDSSRGGRDGGGDSRRSWFGGGGGDSGGPGSRFGGGGFGGPGFGGPGSGENGSRGGGDQASQPPAGSSLKIVGKSRKDHVAYDVPTAAERLPDEVPSWFKSLDANADGQLAMSEYKATWSASDIADFAQFDLNSDGIIHFSECLAATERGAVRGSPSSAVIAATTSSDSGSTGPSTAASLSSSTPESSSSASSDSGDANDRYIRYAVGFIRKYDENGDGVLVKEEWSKMSRDYSHADEDMDGKITPTELAKAMTQR